MTAKTHTVTLRLEPGQFDQLERNRLMFGTPYSEQVRRALAEWFDRGGLATEGPALTTVPRGVLAPLDSALREWDAKHRGGPADPLVERVRTLRARMQPDDDQEVSPAVESARERVRKRAPKRRK